MKVQHFEWADNGMEAVGNWGSYVHSDDYNDLQCEKAELQKKYDALVNKISELYWMA